MLAMVLMVMQSGTVDAAQLVAETRALTRATVECRMNRADDEIVVCARRDADRWRVPLLTPDPGAIDPDDVPAQRERLIAQPSNCTEMRIMAYGCGAVGVTMHSGRGGTRLESLRPLAP